MKALKALVYTRVSTKEQAEGFSLETQREACEKKAKELGAVDIVFLEDTYTGIELDRPAMNLLRDYVRERQVDMIVVYDPDRFSRDLNDLLIVTKEIDRAGITLHFVNFDWQNTPQGMLFLQLRGAIAQFEHAQIRERTTRGKRKKAEKGMIRTYARPYGYNFNKETDCLEINEEEAKIVRLIFEWYIRDENPLSPYEIAKRLADMGVPGPKGPNWIFSSIHRMLRNETYAGRLVRDDEQPDWQPILVPPIIDRATFEKAQARLKERARYNPKATKGEFLLQRLVFCGLCGKAMTVKTRTQKGRAWSYYTCNGRYQRDFGPAVPTCCTLPPYRTTALDQEVWSRISELLKDPEKYMDYLMNSAKDDGARQRLEQARTRLARVEQARDKVNHAWFSGYLESEEEFRKYLAEYRAKVQEIKQEIEHLEAVIKDQEAAQEGIEVIRSYAAKLAGSVDDLPFKAKQELVRTLVERVVVRPDLIEIRGHFVMSERVAPGEVASALDSPHRETGHPETPQGNVRPRLVLDTSPLYLIPAVFSFFRRISGSEGE